MRFLGVFLALAFLAVTRGRRVAGGVAGVFMALSLVVVGSTYAPEVHARRPNSDLNLSALATVPLAELPAEGQRMHALILQGGPFRYDKDGVVFGNRERILPAQPRGYYREYTVRTPGERSRGARRIVCGGEPRQPDACFYSDDHYASFRRIAP